MAYDCIKELKANTKSFLEAVPILVWDPPIVNKSGVAKFSFDRHEDIGAQTVPSRVDIRRFNGTAEISAYWCPYEENIAAVLTVGADAEFMFTANMTGCTFVIGRSPTGITVVSHSNAQQTSADYITSNDDAISDGMDLVEVRAKELRDIINNTLKSSGYKDPDGINVGSRAAGSHMENANKLLRRSYEEQSLKLQKKEQLIRGKSSIHNKLGLEARITYAHSVGSDYVSTIIGSRNKDGSWIFYKQDLKAVSGQAYKVISVSECK